MISHLENGSTISLADAVATRWDVVVLGAGVAGCSMACHLASRGLSVLIAEAKRFPRDKVCGGCLNVRAQRSLARLGLLPHRLPNDVPSIAQLHVHVRGRVSCWPVPAMMSVRRSTLDQSLLDLALEAGAQVLMETRGQVLTDPERGRLVQMCPVSSHERSVGHPSVSSKYLIVASGLTRSPLARDEQWKSDIAHDSRVGCHALVAKDSLVSDRIPLHGVLHMIVGDFGYLGICETDGDMLDLAAALDPAAIKEWGSIGSCIDRLLANAGLQWKEVAPRRSWEGTPWLTRVSSPVARDGIFLLGDALGYIEPFTGEGMSWALQGAEALAEILDPEAARTQAAAEEAWTQWVNNHRRWNQRIATWVSRQARHPGRAQHVLTLLDWLPPLRSLLLRRAMQ